MARTSDIVIKKSGNDTLVYDLKSNKAVCLNETAAIVWKLCDGKCTISKIVVEAGKQMKSRIDEDFVLFALDQLNKDGLLSEGFEQNDRFVGLTRREVVRKVGIGSMVAIPFVSSILAPPAANAQSNTCPTSPCFLPAQVANCPIQCGTQVAELRSYSSTNGTCSGTETIVGAFICGGGGIISSFDLRIF